MSLLIPAFAVSPQPIGMEAWSSTHATWVQGGRATQVQGGHATWVQSHLKYAHD